MPVIDLRPIRKMTHGGVDYTRLYVGSTLVYDTIDRVLIADTEAVVGTGNSLLATATGIPDWLGSGDLMTTIWPGDLTSIYIGGAMLKDLWDSNGDDRAVTAAAAWIVQEYFTNTGTEVFADPASTQGQETLQYLYWYALTAQQKGAGLFGIYLGWPHSSITSAGDLEMLQKAQYWREWLQARPEITIPVYIIPTPQFVRQAEPVQFAADSNYTRPADEIHLHAWQQIDDGLGHMVKMFLTGAKSPDDPGRAAVLQTHIDNAWAILTTYECTGLGTTTVTAWPVASDPLPSPLPLPGPPAQPAAPTFSAITDTGATVSWVAPADGGSAITSYTMEWRPVGGSITTEAGITTLSEPLTGLTAETEYEARITAINALGSSTPSAWAQFETEATVTGPAILMELTPTTYTGPTLSSGAWPAASGGYRTLAAADPAAIELPLSMAGDGYIVIEVRRPSFSGSLAVLSLSNGGYGSSPWWTLNANGYESKWNTGLVMTTGGQAVSPTFMSSGFVTIEIWKQGSTVSISVNGETPVTSPSAGTGSNATTQMQICRDEGSGGATVDIAAIRVRDGIPDAAGRAADRAWAIAQAPS